MCSYQCCFFPGAPSVARISAVSAFPTAVEVSPVSGVSNIPGGLVVVCVPAVVCFLAVVASSMLLLA